MGRARAQGPGAPRPGGGKVGAARVTHRTGLDVGHIQRVT
ncbi:30S ribosomal protein S11 (fragment) [Micrococcus luteus]